MEESGQVPRESHHTSKVTPMIEDTEQKSSLSLTHGRIIVVDDEPMVTTSITTMLNLESDYQATGYNSPQKALDDLVDETPTDVVISDY